MGCLSLWSRSTRRDKPSKDKGTSPSRSIWRPLSTATRQQVSLPPELVLHILHLAAEEDGRTAASTVALLCKATCERVRQALYVTPELHSARQISLLIRTVTKNARLAAMVEGLRLDGKADVGGLEKRSPLTTRLPKVFEACRSVREVEIRNVILFSLADFSAADNLQHLTLESCLLSDRTTTTRYHAFFTPIPQLQSLSLRHIQFDFTTAEHFLCERTLPHLVALELDGCCLVADPANLADLGPFNPVDLAPRLEVLRIHGGGEEPEANRAALRNRNPADPFDLVEKCSNLRSLTVPISALSAHVLEALPVEHLTHLALLPARQGEPDLLEPHLAAAYALSISFLALAAVAPSTSATGSPLSSSPWGSRVPLSLSHGAAYSPAASPPALSPFSSAAPSPAAERTPLSQLLYLSLPASWDVESAAGQAFKANGEFAWALGRIMRECAKRDVAVRFIDEGQVEGAYRAGAGMKEEVLRVRREAAGEDDF
ncbi:hypothetical protein JCM10207_008025 [Rhodosporidiobolus poonsookiae]